MNQPLADKVVVVTGGGRGIGRMITEGLLRAGARVYISSRKERDLETAVAELGDLGPIRAVTADLATPEGVRSLAQTISERESQVHGLFNNAGANWGAPFEEFPSHAWDRVLAVNLKGAFLLTQALAPLLRSASSDDDAARVINVGSVDGLRAPSAGFNNFSYSASKAGIHLLTQQLAVTLAPRILVNAIAPGLFPSRMTATLLQDGGGAHLAAHIPLQRIGRGSDIAGIATFLMSQASAYITGAVIPIDGGITAAR
jgi:NAD(P)-dependent dehydrogenase (short-subunit alcohol dehydrogenase family)